MLLNFFHRVTYHLQFLILYLNFKKTVLKSRMKVIKIDIKKLTSLV